jgi:hypothetical protein
VSLRGHAYVRAMSSERGQASIEWVALLLLVSIAMAAALAFVPAVDGRPLGAALARALVCAVKGDCHAEGAALRKAYGERDAALVRAQAPNIVYEPGTLTLPVDYRRCRSHRCSDAPDDRDLDVHRSARGGVRATAFTHVVHRGGRSYIQYWLYYPDSPSTFAHSHGIIKRFYEPLGIHDPGFHNDDWEGYQVRIDADGTTSARSTRHGGYASCKGRSELSRAIVENEGSVRRIAGRDRCETWGTPNGWTRVSRGSHAGHIPDRTPGTGLHERATMAPGIRLVPLETLDHDTYRPLPHGIKPPWTKEVYKNPAGDTS